ncbi:MAG: rRNA pseudouridine synthase [Fuerstiella sp.]|nr:rRNA pseudouridine synthase [Fuerstiella sp.]
MPTITVFGSGTIRGCSNYPQNPRIAGTLTMPRRTPSKNRSRQRSMAAASSHGQRLQKFIATAGVDSRRKCEGYIREGRVMVNSQTVTDPGHAVDPDTDIVLLDGERLRLPKPKYYLLNKPKGVLCTNRDPSGRPRAIDLVPGDADRLFTVGRLDENTEGLLLLTNDGDLAEHMAHPRYEVVREYRAQVAGVPTPKTLTELRKGMHFADGLFRFREVRFLKRRGHSAFLEIQLREGKNREVRRMLARCGHKVIQLQRVAFGPLRIGRLKPGQCRELRSAEIRELRDFVSAQPGERSTNGSPNRGTGSRRKIGRHKARKATPAKRAPARHRSQPKD